MQLGCKRCFKCGEVKPLSAFYKHHKMADGHVNKCKVCNNIDVKENRASKVEYYRAYDNARGTRCTSAYSKRYRQENPKKYAAHGKVNNAVRDGKLTPKSCEICGKLKAVAHHDDYDKQLDVRWLCQVHHKEWHALNGEGLNAH